MIFAKPSGKPSVPGTNVAKPTPDSIATARTFVSVWWELENGKAVGWNEGRRGWSFPVRTLNRKAMGRPRIWDVPADDGHFYVCATNGRKAVKLIHRADYDITFRKVAKYSTDDWGDAMRGIAREPGVWIVRHDGDKPERLV